jgi:crotonobetainyl-CoA:carnitine CoA-transferase CaiB-like acyl-CoA transferase
MSETKPLHGIRVLDLTRVIVGPTATMLLGDMGAEIIKLEPRAGDDTRYMQQGDDPDACPYFLAVNRNKRGMVLDLTRAEGLAVFRDLAARADVLVHNFRPGIVERLKIAYDDVRAVAPRIVYCAISAFGDSGPYAGRPGTDVVFQAMGGLMSITGEPGGRPYRAGAPIVDVAAGVSAAFAILAALIRRMNTGEGDYISGSLFDQAVFLQSPLFTWSAQERSNPPRVGNHSPLVLVLDLETADGTVIVSIPGGKFWRLFCTVIGMPALIADDRFRTAKGRLRNQAAVMALAGPPFRAETTRIWVDRLVAAGVPCGPVQFYDEVLSDPQLACNGTFLSMERASAEASRVVNFPFRLRHAPIGIERSAPTLGRDTDAILVELGYDEAKIAALRRTGVITPEFATET